MKRMGRPLKGSSRRGHAGAAGRQTCTDSALMPRRSTTALCVFEFATTASARRHVIGGERRVVPPDSPRRSPRADRGNTDRGPPPAAAPRAGIIGGARVRHLDRAGKRLDWSHSSRCTHNSARGPAPGVQVPGPGTASPGRTSPRAREDGQGILAGRRAWSAVPAREHTRRHRSAAAVPTVVDRIARAPNRSTGKERQILGVQQMTRFFGCATVRGLYSREKRLRPLTGSGPSRANSTDGEVEVRKIALMKIAVVGRTGVLGLVAGACLAETGTSRVRRQGRQK